MALNTANMVRFVTCTKAEYTNATKNPNVFYKVTDGSSFELYLGSELLSNQAELEAAIGRIAANESAISALQQAVAGWVQYDDTAVRGLISAEAQAREAADNGLSSQISTLSGNVYTKGEIDTKVGTLNSAINGKVAQSAYDTKVAELEGLISAADTKAGNAANAASAADQKAQAAQGTANDAKAAIDAFLKDADTSEKAVDTLKEIQTQLDAGDASAASLLASINQLTTDLGAEVTNRTNADTTLDGKISQNATDIGLNTAAIGQLQTDLATEKSNRENAISDLTTVVNGKVAQSDFNTLSGTVSGHTTSISGLQTSVSNNATAISNEESRATGRENAIEQNINNYKDTVASTYETKTDANSKKSALEGQISQARTDLTGTDNYTSWNNTAFASTVGGAKDFAYQVAMNTSAGAVKVAQDNATNALEAFANKYLTWNTLSSLN